MFIRFLLSGTFLCLLVGCGSAIKEPTLSASGYLASDGVVRIWSKVSAEGQPMRLLSVYTPFTGDTILTNYEYADGLLSVIQRETQNQATLPIILLRFDRDGNPNFMVRKLADRNERLSADDILRLRYGEQRMQTLAASLSAGDIVLHQGIVRNNKIITCQGDEVSLVFLAEQQAWLDKRISDSGFVSLAWLTAPQGIQLLLVGNENFCKWEPTIETF